MLMFSFLYNNYTCPYVIIGPIQPSTEAHICESFWLILSKEQLIGVICSSVAWFNNGQLQLTMQLL